MVKNMLTVEKNAREDYATLKTVKTILVSAKSADICQKKEMLKKVSSILMNDINDDDSVWMLENIINTALDLAGSGAILHNNLDRMIGLAEKELLSVMDNFD